MMPKYINRFAEHYEQQGKRVEILDDKLWVDYHRVVVPIGPITVDYAISDEQAAQLMKKFPGSLMVRYTKDYNCTNCEEWYAVICDEFKDLESYRHENRRKIKKGLKNCEVRQVDAGFIAESGYEIYTSAFSRYQDLIKPMGNNDFMKMVKLTKDFDDIYHYWAVFRENKLIAYATIRIYGDEEAEISVTKFMPEYLKYYPSNALFYTMAKHYILDNSMQYVNNGFRNIHHKTNVHEFLIEKLSFKKVYLNLCITYYPVLSSFLKFTYLLRGGLSRVSSRLKAIYQLEEINRKCATELLQCNAREAESREINQTAIM
jgi:hypothetical protein